MDDLKKKLGEAALEKVKDGMLVGLGTGSTVTFFIKALGKKVQKGGLQKTKFTSSSYATLILARKCELPLVELSQVSKVDLYVDGADEVDPLFNLIKGRGAAMVQEKVLAEMANDFLVLVDESKKVNVLCSKYALPVEFVPVSLSSVENKLKALGGSISLRIGVKKDGPVITDQGFFIFDTKFESNKNWKELNVSLNSIPGVLGHGLFLKEIVKEVWIASTSDGITKKRNNDYVEKSYSSFFKERI